MSNSEPSDIAAAPAATLATPPLPVLRIPMTDRDGALFAYEIVFHRSRDDEQTLLQQVLSTITDGSLTRLARGNRAFLNLPIELLSENADVLLHQPRLGLMLQASLATDPDMMKRLQQMADRGCQLMLDAGDLDIHGSVAMESLLKMVQYVRLDATITEPEALEARIVELSARGIWVIAGRVDDHETCRRCMSLPVDAVQGRFLLIPEIVDVPVLTANRLNMLRLMGVLHEANPGPVELANIIRDDAVLSYKLLSCVNSAYFALPRQLKTVQQAAIFFGVTRMRNWIDTMSLCTMDDRPPELLRTALIRAHMCEKMALGMPGGKHEMAFTVGLFSLLDALMGASMEYLLDHLRLMPEISEALIENSGPFAPILAQVIAWESGTMTIQQAPKQRLERMAQIYLEATGWADQVYSGVSETPREVALA